LTGGSWLDLDDRGVVPAAVLNKVGTLGRGDGRNDRGAISLLGRSIVPIPPRQTWLGRSRSPRVQTVHPGHQRCPGLVLRAARRQRLDPDPKPGLFMVTAREPSDPACARIYWQGPRAAADGDWWDRSSSRSGVEQTPPAIRAMRWAS